MAAALPAGATPSSRWPPSNRGDGEGFHDRPSGGATAQGAAGAPAPQAAAAAAAAAVAQKNPEYGQLVVPGSGLGSDVLREWHSVHEESSITMLLRKVRVLEDELRKVVIKYEDQREELHQVRKDLRDQQTQQLPQANGKDSSQSQGDNADSKAVAKLQADNEALTKKVQDLESKWNTLLQAQQTQAQLQGEPATGPKQPMSAVPAVLSEETPQRVHVDEEISESKALHAVSVDSPEEDLVKITALGTTDERQKALSHNLNAMEDEYCLNNSVWDASIILICRDKFGNRLLHNSDTFMLVFAFLLNLTMQTMFLLIVYLDMLRVEEFTVSSTADMLEWRAQNGHMLEGTEGRTAIDLYCSEGANNWSFNKDSLGDWITYLSTDVGQVPGIWLGLLSLLLWSMTVMLEFRSVTEQCQGVLSIPAIEGVSRWSFRWGAVHQEFAEDGSVTCEIVGMTAVTKAMVACIVTIPRMALLICLALFGAEFVAKTPSLVDLLLNAIALAFVLDIDELLAGICFTKHVRMMCSEMKPLPLGRVSGLAKGCGGREVLRYLVWVGFVAFCIFVYLLPFHDLVVDTKIALCSGDRHFIALGGNDTVPTTIISDFDDMLDKGAGDEWETTCSVAVKKEYFPKFYPAIDRRALNNISDNDIDSVAAGNRKWSLTLQHAFRDMNAQDMRKMHPNFMKAWDMVVFGSDAPVFGEPVDHLEPCPRFGGEWGWHVCQSVPSLMYNQQLTNCSWTRASSLCDGIAPGEMWLAACDFSTRSAKIESCARWALFGRTNPYLNCDTVLYRTPLHLQSSIPFTTDNVTAFMDDLGNDTFVDFLSEQLRRTLEELPERSRLDGAEALSLNSTQDGESMVLVQSITPGRRLQSGGPAAGVVDVGFLIRELPDSLTPDYTIQADWALMALNLNAELTNNYAASYILNVSAPSTSAVYTAYCDIFEGCEPIGQILKLGAESIEGDSVAACCDESCGNKVVSWEVTQEGCRALNPNYEILREESDLRRIRAFGNLDVTCCEEQLLCSALDVGTCVGHRDRFFYDSLIENADTTYQGENPSWGPQDDEGWGPLDFCCTVSCFALQESEDFECDWRQGQMEKDDLINITMPNDPNWAWWWFSEDGFRAHCCYTSTTLCEVWNNRTLATEPYEQQCYQADKAPIPDADTTYGEEERRCCIESCFMYQDWFDCSGEEFEQLSDREMRNIAWDWSVEPKESLCCKELTSCAKYTDSDCQALGMAGRMSSSDGLYVDASVDQNVADECCTST